MAIPESRLEGVEIVAYGKGFLRMFVADAAMRLDSTYRAQVVL